MILAVDRFRSLKTNMPAAAPMAAMRADQLNEMVVVTGSRLAQQEQLGDLKLYRIPDRTTFASRQSKQVRLMDQLSIPVTSVYQANLEDASDKTSAAHRVLRTRNTLANHLGLPLPSGRVAVFAERDGERLLQHESGIRDIAVDEEVEIDMGESPDVQVSLEQEARDVDAAHAKQLPLVPGEVLRSVKADAVLRVEISNARASATQFELQISLPEGARIVRADHPVGTKNGRPIFRFKVPANDTVTVRLQTQTVDEQILRTP